MEQKIKQAFRAKYNKVNLSNERLENYVAKWATKIESEDAINVFLDALDIEPLEEIAKLDDALRAKGKTEETKEPEQPKDDLIQKQIDELKSLLEQKNKTDLSKTRSEQLNDLPSELKATLKFVKLEDLSDDDFISLKTDLNTQAESIKLAKSQTNPLFAGQGKPGSQISEEKAKEIANRI